MDAMPPQFCCGELEGAIIAASTAERPDVILIEGQGALSHPAFCTSAFILRGSQPDALILQHAPKRMHRCDFPNIPMPSPSSEIALIEAFTDTKAIGITVNHERMTEAEITHAIAALAAAAIRKNTVHGIILMVEMGDRREGILPENLHAIAQQVAKISGVILKGIGANFTCLGETMPTGADMVTLCKLAAETTALCDPLHQTLSGGHSANLPWAMSGKPTGCINDLRLGEAILLGADPVSGTHIDGLYKNAFTLVAKVIETNTRSTHLILVLGHQDTDINGLSMPHGCKFIGATSDHLIVSKYVAPQHAGCEMRFQMNYSALMHAMAAPDINILMLAEGGASPQTNLPNPP